MAVEITGLLATWAVVATARFRLFARAARVTGAARGRAVGQRNGIG